MKRQKVKALSRSAAAKKVKETVGRLEPSKRKAYKILENPEDKKRPLLISRETYSAQGYPNVHSLYLEDLKTRKELGFLEYLVREKEIHVTTSMIPGFEKKGVGREFVKIVEDLAKRKKIPKITLNATKKSARAWEKMGFKRTGEKEKMVQMEKKIRK